MQKSNRSKVVFKDYNVNQNMLLPPSLEELIEANHPVRIVNQVIDGLNIEPLLSKYKGGGTSSYHPRLLLKVVVYGYLTNLYSSRKMEQALKENIHFMWLSGMSYPDHNTINRFRSERLQGVLKEVFSQVVHFLAENGYVTLKEIYLDGTKLEANANRYTFVWGRGLRSSRERIGKQLKELWSYAERVAREELADTGEDSFEQINPQKVKEVIEQIDQALKGRKVDKKVRQKLKYARKRWPENLEKYEQLEQQMVKRNSFSKTDPDATFMRMKEDHMRNGQLKPGYNWQISTQNQYILGYTLHQTPNDTTTLAEHINQFEQHLGVKPQAVVADAGYGSEENYTFLEYKRIEPYVKYNYFHKEQSKKWKEDPSRIDNLYYNEEKDCFYCPMGQSMTFVKEFETTTDNGFKQTKRVYQAENCSGCPMRGPCHKGKSNRKIEVNLALMRYKKKVRELLNSEQGLYYRSKRPVEPEAVFGMIKNNRHYRRFLLRGLDKVEIEAGLLCLAHNIKKMAG